MGEIGIYFYARLWVFLVEFVLLGGVSGGKANFSRDGK